jgi:hypothetical protein
MVANSYSFGFSCCTNQKGLTVLVAHNASCYYEQNVFQDCNGMGIKGAVTTKLDQPLSKGQLGGFSRLEACSGELQLWDADRQKMYIPLRISPLR